MVRFDDYWNASAEQARGFHLVTDIAVATFPQTSSGYDLRNTAMVTGDIHYAEDSVWEPLVYDDMIDTPEINYVDRGVSAVGVHAQVRAEFVGSEPAGIDPHA